MPDIALGGVGSLSLLIKLDTFLECSTTSYRWKSRTNALAPVCLSRAPVKAPMLAAQLEGTFSEPEPNICLSDLNK